MMIVRRLKPHDLILSGRHFLAPENLGKLEFDIRMILASLDNV